MLLAASAGGAAPARRTLHSASATSPITLPAQIGGYRDIVDVEAARTGSSHSKIINTQRTHQATVRKATVAAYGKAFGGVAADYREYANHGLTRLPWVIAVRAPAPALTIGPIEDLPYLQLATPERAVVTVGTASCEVAWTQITLAGHRPNPADEVALECERTGSDITVFAGGGGSFNGPSGIRDLAALANAAWVAVSTT